jgi:spermidine/putrescine transport system substrate-binding protein
MQKALLRSGSLMLSICATILFSLTQVQAKDHSVSESRELVYLSWSEYIDPELIKEFEKKFNCRVKEVYYETDELKDDMLIETNGSGYDVVLSSGLSIIPYIQRNWVMRLNTNDIPNLKHIDPRWLEAQPKIAGYAVPYLWGTMGIAYRQDLVKEKIESWTQLFKPAEYLRNKIVMIKDSRETLGLALKSLGYSFNSTEPEHYKQAEGLLLAQRPFVREYSYISWDEDSLLITGDVLMAMIYNGDALVLKDKLPQIAYAVPREGTGLWIDYLVVMQASKNKKLAHAFINFLNEPENAARLSAYLYFATPNAAAEKLLPKDILDNPDIYPDKTIMQKSEFYQELPPRIIKKRNEIFSKVTH